jgi:type IV secretion system protein VirB11
MHTPSSLRPASQVQARRFASLRTAAAPILPFLNDDSVVEIMLNADGSIWVEQVGVGMFRSNARLAPDDALRMLRLVATEMNTELTDRCPSLSGKLPLWGARVQALVPPVVEAPVFALRKPARVLFTLDDYVENEILTEAAAVALTQAVLERKNILVGGGTGSGKTTLANALLHVVASTSDRVYIVEDNAELQCAAPNKVQVLVQNSVHSWQRAIMDAMRLRPERIVVGEVRDGSALELIKAWNTGHPGGIATVHANDTRAMLDRICQLIEEVVPAAPRQLIAQTVDLCVHIRRDKGHRSGRSISGIDRVVGIANDGQWHLEPLR